MGEPETIAESQTRPLGESTSEQVAPGAPHGPGTRLGRYIVIDEVGHGGMGRVYRAYDPRLGREVALKQLTRSSRLSEENAVRMLREAQAMAKLSHPNVVPVYDVEGDGAELVIAMEFVEGETLGRWLEAEERPVDQVTTVFRGAGTGLAVAHEAGLVHRDFKPGNVMLGEDGRARVMDFGLARTDPSSASNSSMGADASQDQELSSDESLTCAGTVMGTPAYMAPEQHRGADDVGPAADQYAFCIALWEALYGKRPFEGGGVAVLAEAKLAGAPRPPAGRHVPPWLYRVVVRGLAVNPADRWPTMRALVEALGRDPAVLRRRVLAVGGVVVGISGLAAFATAAPEPCEDSDESLADVWNPEVRASMVAALEATDLSYASRTAELATGHLDDYTERWLEGHTDACRATHVRHDQSAEVLDRRVACLGRAKTELGAVLDLLTSDVDQRTLERTQRLVEGLPSLDRCSDVSALLAKVPPPEDPTVAAQVEEIEARLAAAAVRGRIGRAKEALETIDSVLAEAEATGYLPLLARARVIHARLLERSGRYEEGAEAMERAYITAVEAGDDEQASVAAVELAFFLGDRMAQTERAHLWLEIAGALARRTDPGGVGEALYFNNLGNVLKSEGRLDEAIAAYDRAAELYAAKFGESSTQMAMTLSNSAVALNEQHRPDDALPRLERALAMEAEAFGEEHPRVATTAINLGLVLHALHRYDEAVAHHTRARDVLRGSMGQDHPYYAAALTNIAMARIEQGRLEEAEPLLVRSLEIKEAALGMDHRGLVPQLTNLGMLAVEQKKHREGLGYMQRARDILVALHGESHHLVAMTEANLGTMFSALGEFDEARRHLDAAIAYHEKVDGADAPSLGMPLAARGEVELNAGNGLAAEPWFERALAVQVKNDMPAPEIALAKFGLARARAEDAARADEAKQLAEQALAVFVEYEDTHVDEVRTWLRSLSL